MQCKELEAILEHHGLSPLPADAREHLAVCNNCQVLLADLTSIVAIATEIPAEVAPPDRVWTSLRARLQAEGIIREEQPVILEQHSWWRHFSAALRPRTLATAGIGIALALGLYLQSHKSPALQQNPAKQENVAGVKTGSDTPTESAARPVQTPATAASPNLLAPRANTPAGKTTPVEDVPLRPSPSELAATTLTNVEQDLPNMQLAGNSAVDTSLRQNLRTLNEFIAECQQRLKQNPQDALAREYLYSAYQQKAELLSAMMESGRSEH